jgi:outer membrane protein OmpA-like peptidoglycan-associated protein
MSITFAQTNLLLNGGFEDINTCTEYESECGVEGWFYLRDVKAQMYTQEEGTLNLGSNSYAVFYDWIDYTGFAPIIGTMLPCSLKKGNKYTFSGLLSAKLNPKLVFVPGVVTGEYYYVPNRPFTKAMQPDSIVQLTPVPDSRFYKFEYSFVATGNETYLTFGAFVKEDAISGKRMVNKKETIELIMDNFTLTPADPTEGICSAFAQQKKAIYSYNYRHKLLDNTLYAKGKLPVVFTGDAEELTATTITPVKIPLTDTLRLGDVLFDFNKADLKPEAETVLGDFFTKTNLENIDSIVVQGHTDSVGTEERNQTLSQQRSTIVARWLQRLNIIIPEKINTQAFGKSRPVATNTTPEGRAANRRVEIIIFRREL